MKDRLFTQKTLLERAFLQLKILENDRKFVCFSLPVVGASSAAPEDEFIIISVKKNKNLRWRRALSSKVFSEIGFKKCDSELKNEKLLPK